MPAIKKLSKGTQHCEATIDPSLKSYHNDPFVLKKVEKARQTVNQFGLPGDKKK